MKLSRLQLIFLLTWAILGTGVITIPYAIAHFTTRDGWIAVVLFLAGASVAAGVVWLFKNVFPEDSLFSAFDKAFGKVGGRLGGILGVVWAYVFMCMLVRELNLFVEVTILPRTPLSLINFAILIPVIFVVFNGIEVLGRIAEMFSLPILALYLIMLLLPLRVADFHLLIPVLVNGWTPVLRASINPDIAFALQFIVALVFIEFSNKETLVKDVFIAAGIVFSTLLFFDILVTTVLGSAAGYLAFPGLEVIRSIRYGQLIERLDTLLVLMVLVTMFFKFSVFHYVLCDFLRYTFKLSSVKTVAIPAAAAVWGGSLLFWKNASDLQNYMLFVTPVWFFVVLVGVPLSAVVVWSAKKRFASAQA